LITPDELARRLSARTRAVSRAEGRAAAVLVALSAQNDDVSVLIIKRTDTLRHHSGQYALPGGSRDPGDETAVATALREAHEEVGIAPGDVRVLGVLDDLATITNFVVTPVVGWIPQPYPLTLNTAEVAFAVHLPLRAFLEPPTETPVPPTATRASFERVVLSFDVDGHVIWGATARILRELADVVRG
jgi:8-oxo-dGTP pyrophosphatase MutT (NUDIX family)